MNKQNRTGLDDFAGAVQALREFVRIPSVSSDPARAHDVRRCAQWLATYLQRAGLSTVRIVPTRGHPIVFAEWLKARGAPTLLIYGHYDVQPAGAGDGWRSPPFAAEVRDGAICGRGASDDKGQLFAHVVALQRSLRTRGALPVKVAARGSG